MPKETKDQRVEREAKEAEQVRLHREEYLKTVPKRLMDAQALAQVLGVSVSISLTSTGPKVSFQNEEGPYVDYHLTYESEEWEVDALERDLREIKAQQDARRDRRLLAQEVFSRLTPTEKSAVKEFIFSLS